MLVLHPPDSPIAHLMPQISRRHFRRIHALLGDLGLYRGQPVLLAVLWEHEGLAHSELARHLGVTPATITKMVQRMEQAGFVSRQPDPADQRISRVYLTEQGRLIRHQVDEVFRTLDQDMMAGFDEAEYEQLLGYLQRVAANLERNPVADPSASEQGSEPGIDPSFTEEITP